MKTLKGETLLRPVRCHFCAKPMFYVGEEGHVPEVRVEVEGAGCSETFYAHVSCWNRKVTPDNLP